MKVSLATLLQRIETQLQAQGIEQRASDPRVADVVREQVDQVRGQQVDAQVAALLSLSADQVAAFTSKVTAHRANSGILSEADALGISAFVRGLVRLTHRIGTDTPKPTGRMQWLASRASSAHASGSSVMERAAIDESAAHVFLHEGLMGEAPRTKRLLTDHRLVLSELDPAQRRLYYTRARDLNNILWTEACFDAARRVAALDVASDPCGTQPERMAYASLDMKSFVWRDNPLARTIDDYRKSVSVDPLVHRTHCWRTMPTPDEPFVGKRYLTGGDVFPGNFYVRIPEGHFGERLSRALVEATRIAMNGAAEAGQVAKVEALGSAAPKLMLLAGEPNVIVAEGIASIATTIGLLLAQGVHDPNATVESALDLVAQHKLVTRVAVLAPFGLLAPIAAVGLTPSEPLGMSSRGDGPRVAQLPEGFTALLDHVADKSRERLHHHPDLEAAGSNRNETGRGCPVAGRGPLPGPGGGFVMSDDAGLSVLTTAFVGLVKKVLAADP